MTIGALEAGGTKMVLAAFDETGKELERMTIPTEEPAVTMPPMQQFFDRWKIDALGVGSFGPLDPNPDSPTYGYITSTPKLKWKDYPLLPELLQGKNSPAAITNAIADANNFLIFIIIIPFRAKGTTHFSRNHFFPYTLYF